jgi:hypothetical protein
MVWRIGVWCVGKKTGGIFKAVDSSQQKDVSG